MTDILRSFIAIIVLSLIIVLLRSFKGEYSVLLQLSVIVVIGFVVVSDADDVIDCLEEITSVSTSAAQYIKILLKALCISVLTDISSSFCMDCSNQTLAKGVELIGKTAILSLSFPLIKSFVENISLFLG